MNLKQRYKIWKFKRALNKFRKNLSPEWLALSWEEQEAEIDRIIKEVRAEKRAAK